MALECSRDGSCPFPRRRGPATFSVGLSLDGLGAYIMFSSSADTLLGVSSFSIKLSAVTYLLRVDRTLQLSKIRLRINRAQENGLELIHPSICK